MKLQEPTPSPWVACERGDYSDFEGNSSVILADGKRVAVVHHAGDAESDVNARLIEKAPDMLKIVEMIASMDRYESTDVDADEIDEAREMIHYIKEVE
jgi:hypothetical protein